MTHPGVGPLDGTRLRVDHRNSDAVSTRQADRHVRGDDPVCEESSARKQRLGHISKQGSLLVALLVGGKQPKAAGAHSS